MKFDVIIPLRSKSEGLKNKNILKFSNNDNLTNYTIKKIINFKLINKIYILTDSKKYKKKILSHNKIDKSFIRKKKHSNRNSKIQDLVLDFLKSFNHNCPTNLVLLQVTSPLLSKEEILKTLNFIKKKKIESLFHISRVLEHPNEIVIGKNSNWKFLIKKELRIDKIILINIFLLQDHYFSLQKTLFLNIKSYLMKNLLLMKLIE